MYVIIVLEPKLNNFPIIHALCRAALSNPSNAVVRQIERLKKALEKEGSTSEAIKLESLLKDIEESGDMAPSRIERSKVNLRLMGEELTPKTPVPVDKETSTALAEIVFPFDLSDEPPIFGQHVTMAVESVINEWDHWEKLLSIGAQPSRSCLIYGAPGTGKTHLALWMAQRMNLPVVLARLDGLMSSFLGTTSRNIGNLFKFASKYKCILLLDEFDAIAKLRNDPQEVGEIKRVVNTLLQNLDARRELGVTIGITNHELLLDPAIWRRFDIQIEIPKPTPDVMTHIIEKFIKPLSFKDEELKFFAWCIDGGTGADAKSLCQWIKKAHVFGDIDGLSLMELLQKYALLNSGRITQIKKESLFHIDDELITKLHDDSNFDFRQKEIAHIVGLTPSSLSKKLSRKKLEGDNRYVQ